VNRIKGLLFGQALVFVTRLEKMRTGDGEPLPPRLGAEVRRGHARLMLAHEQIGELERARRAELAAAAPGSAAAKVFYRSFDNRR
jgi:transposase